MKRWHYLWVFVFLTLATVILVWQLKQPGTKRRAVRPDGQEIILSSVTLGTNSTYAAGNLFQRTIGPRLPTRLKAWFKVREMTVRVDRQLAGRDVLVAWIEFHPPTNNLIVRVADDSGREQGAHQPQASSVFLPSGAGVTAHVFSSFPRRSRFLTVRVYVLGKEPLQRWAEFRVRNPAYGKYPAWKPEPLPITRETNGLTFNITHFNTGLYATGHMANMSSNWTEIAYECNVGPWNPTLITLADATGNFIYDRGPMQRMMAVPRPPGITPTFDPSRQGVVSVPAMLWLDEPAWKVHIELQRSQRNSFRSNEWWEVSDIAVPLFGQTNQLNLSPEKYGTNIIFKSLAVTKDGLWRVRIDLKRLPRSELRASLLRVTDQRGTNLHFVPATRASTDAYVLDAAAAEAQKLNFRFAIHHVITLDFLAKPQFVHTNIAKDVW